MILAHDLALRQTTAVGPRALSIERSRADRLQVSLRENRAAALLGEDAFLLFTLKEKGRRNSDPLLAVTLVAADRHEESQTYRKSFDVVTEGINTLLGITAGAANTITSKACEGQFSYRASDQDDWQDGEPFEVTLVNSLRNEEDGTPAGAPTPDEDWVAHGHAQSLTSDQKTQARANIGASDGTIADGSVTNAKLTTMPANTIKGNNTGSGATPADLTVAQLKTLLALAIGDTTGLQSALDAKAPLVSSALTGTPTAPTATPGTNSTQIATTAFVIAVRDALLASAPGALDTLNELAAALGNDANFATTITNALAGKASTAHATTHAAGDSDALPWTAIHGKGNTASKPAAATCAGYIYYDTDLNKLQRSDGAIWEDVGESGGASPWVQKTAGYSVSTGDRILADTSSGGWGLTLPASPAIGDEVELLDAFGTFNPYNLTILRNGSSIESQADDVTCDVNKARLLLVYVGGSVGWRVVITP